MTRMLFGVDRQHRVDLEDPEDPEEREELEDFENPEEGNTEDEHCNGKEFNHDYYNSDCDEEVFVKQPKDPFQQKYRKYSLFHLLI